MILFIPPGSNLNIFQMPASSGGDEIRALFPEILVAIQASIRCRQIVCVGLIRQLPLPTSIPSISGARSDPTTAWWGVDRYSA